MPPSGPSIPSRGGAEDGGGEGRGYLSPCEPALRRAEPGRSPRGGGRTSRPSTCAAGGARPWECRSVREIVEWPGLKRLRVVIQFQPTCCVQGHQPPDQAAQSHIQPGLECLHGASTASLGNLFHCVTTLWVDKLPPKIQPKPPLSHFKTIPPCPITIHPHKQLFPS